ncbi:MAG: hypothetical protein ACR2KL_12435 [Nocardioidaceae bacterium]
MFFPESTARRLNGAGVILLLLGAWGALVPFVGPSFGYDMGGGSAWTWSESHATLHLAPGVAAILGGLFLMFGKERTAQRFGAGVAAVAGIWFVVGPSLHPLWAGQSVGGTMDMGGTAWSSALSALGYHYGTGAAISVVAAYAVGVLAVSRGIASDSFPAASRHDRHPAAESSLAGSGR